MSEWAEDSAVPASGHATPGKALAAQREAMGWSVEQVADQLKLAVRQVVALEAGDYASLPGPAVVRGFVRAYAKVVKLDAAPLVAMIELETPAPNDATATTVRRDKPASFSEVRFPSHGKRARPVGGRLALVALVVAAAALAWQFDLIPTNLLPGDRPAAASSQASVTVLQAPLTAKPADRAIETTLVKPDAPLPSNQVPLISVPPVAGPATGAPGAGSPAGVAPAPAAPAPAATANALVLTLRDDSWIEVRRANGDALFKRLGRRGTTETVEITEPVTLVVGNPGAVSATLRGAALELQATPGSTIARVNLK